MQSFYMCQSEESIMNLVKMQPNAKLFYKTFLELGASNLTTILSFNSKAVEYLLSNQHKQLFDTEYPVIYKTQIRKKLANKPRANQDVYYYNSAIDIAIKNEQARGLSTMIDYIINFQNSYISSYLFTKNLPKLIKMGIPVRKLFSSNIFSVAVDFDSWPSSHHDQTFVIKPYNQSFFKLRYNYLDIFPEFPEHSATHLKHRNNE